MKFAAQLLPAACVGILSMTLLGGCGSSGPGTERSTESASGENAGIKRLTPLPRSDNQRVVVLSDEAEGRAGIKIGKAEEKLLEKSVKTTGEVLANANQVSHVNTPVTGRIVDVKVNVGDRVSAGQTLATIHSTDIEQAEADLLQKEGQVRADLKRDLLLLDSMIASAAEQLKLSESTYKRMKSLFDQAIASQAAYQAATIQKEKDTISLDTLRKKRDRAISLSAERTKILTEPAVQKLRLLGLSTSEIDEVRRTRRVDPIDTVDAPAGGIVSERLVNPGELVDPTRQLFTIGAYENVWIKADVYEKDIARMRAGEKIKVEVDSFPDEEFYGKLNYVSDSINPSTRALSVRAEVPNPGFKLKPRMFVRMTIWTGSVRALSVPKTALQDAGDTQVVYVPIGKNRYEERVVKVGVICGDSAAIEGGLRPGERVVTAGSFELRAESLRQST